MSTPTFTFRKTKTGEWVGFGPATMIEAVNPGSDIIITKRDGTQKLETVAKWGKPFTANGKTMVYAYLARDNGASVRFSNRARSTECPVCGEDRDPHARTCWECGHHFN